ncbi:MAG: MFS transporter [Phycisphaeraceae bacterium]|nr:MAG: MFS transporter [Phycisphaeraceae bacterium]
MRPTPQSRWYPGYTIGAVSSIAYIASAPGQTFIISLINVPVSETFGIAPLTLNTAYMVATVAAAFPLVYIGRMTDRLGPRRALALVAGLFGLGCLAMASAWGALGVFIGFFLLRFLGQGSLSLVSQHVLAMWFHRRLGSIQGIKQVVVFAVWVPLPLMAAWLIGEVGWRWAYVIFGAAVALSVIPPALLFVRDRPEDLGLRMDNDPAPALSEPDASYAEPEADPPSAPTPEHAWTLREALRTRAYWILASTFFLTPLIGTAMLFDMQPLLLSRDLSASGAAAAVSAWTATMAVMALPAGLLTDRVRASALISAGMTLIGVSSIMLLLGQSIVAVCAAMVVYGLGQTVVAACGSAAVARYFGRAHHGAIRASITRIAVIGTGLGPLFTGLSVAITGAYVAALMAFAILCLPLAVASMALAPPVSGRGHEST